MEAHKFLVETDVAAIASAETVTANAKGRTRRAIAGGREFLVAPLTLIVPGVLNGSKGRLYYPLEEVAADPAAWNDIPITAYHPRAKDGSPLSATDPQVWQSQGIGAVKNAWANGKLQAEGWFDAELTRQVDPRIYNALKRNQPIELSTGLYTDNDPAPAGAAWNGQPYDYIARNYRPDHLAVLPDEKGACSLDDGCGVLINSKKPDCPT